MAEPPEPAHQRIVARQDGHELPRQRLIARGRVARPPEPWLRRAHSRLLRRFGQAVLNRQPLPARLASESAKAPPSSLGDGSDEPRLLVIAGSEGTVKKFYVPAEVFAALTGQLEAAAEQDAIKPVAEARAVGGRAVAGGAPRRSERPLERSAQGGVGFLQVAVASGESP